MIHAIKISEVESNPPGKDRGNEWIELFSKNYTNGTGYSIYNNDGQEISLNLSFKGYYVYLFRNQWLDNRNERVFLYKNKTLLDSTPVFNDTKDNSLDFSNCGGKWDFLEASKGKENNCPTEIFLEKNISQKDEISKIKILKNKSKLQEESKKPKNLSKAIKKQVIYLGNSKQKIITLNSQVIKSKETNSNLKNKWFVKYSFVMFCIFILGLFILKRKKLKNEWSN